MHKMSVTVGMLFVCFILAVMDMRQIFEYKRLKGEVLILEKQQSQLISRQKQILTSIAVLSSFSRLENLAQNKLGLKKVSPELVKKIILRPSALKENHEN